MRCIEWQAIRWLSSSKKNARVKSSFARVARFSAKWRMRTEIEWKVSSQSHRAFWLLRHYAFRRHSPLVSCSHPPPTTPFRALTHFLLYYTNKFDNKIQRPSSSSHAHTHTSLSQPTHVLIKDLNNMHSEREIRLFPANADGVCVSLGHDANEDYLRAHYNDCFDVGLSSTLRSPEEKVLERLWSDAHLRIRVFRDENINPTEEILTRTHLHAHTHWATANIQLSTSDA